jgi:hypothetical protein
LGLEGVRQEAPLLVAATDNGMIYNKERYRMLVESPDVDAVVFTFRHHISSKNNPQMYGWVKVDGDKATGVSVKVPISTDPYNDHAIVGTFYFKNVGLFQEALSRLTGKNIRVNGEFYVDSLMGELVEMGCDVRVFEVDNYICWGTPDDYETFVYWQSFFHKSGFHPYDLAKDITVKPSEVGQLDQKFRDFRQEYR